MKFLKDPKQSFFKGKTVIVTGASSGIGRSLVLALDEAEANVILIARNEEKLHESISLTKEPARHHAIAMDLTDYEEVKRVIERLCVNTKIDILINNAGVSQRSEAMDTSMPVYKALMEVNYFAVVHLTSIVAAHMIAQGVGVIAVVSSIAGKVGPPFRSGYAASKHALHGYFDVFRAETTDKGIHTIIVCPGYVDTEIAFNALAGDGRKYNKRDDENANGLTSSTLANLMLNAIVKKKNEVYFGKFEVNAVWLKRFMPAILTKMLRKKYLDSKK